ncbi:hypothetical protein V2J09_007506 [Rumex salicifolius]
MEARAAIILCLERDVAFMVDDEETASSVWEKLEMKIKLLCFLLSLPKSYESLVQTLMLVGDTLTMDETRIVLLAYDLRKVATSNMASGSNEQAQGLFATSRGNDRGNSKRDKSRSKSRSLAEIRCYRCGELGH